MHSQPPVEAFIHDRPGSAGRARWPACSRTTWFKWFHLHAWSMTNKGRSFRLIQIQVHELFSESPQACSIASGAPGFLAC